MTDDRQPRRSWLRLAIDELRERPKGNLPALDILRCAAILMVLLLHTGNKFTPKQVTFGWTGVDLFFVLSGFLIGTQLIKELRRTGTVKVRRFILRRGLRIWPLYYFSVLALLGTAWLRGNETLVEQIKSFAPDLLFVSNYFGDNLLGGWSLSTEEQFYIAVPILLFLGSKLAPVRRLVILPIAWLLMPPILRVLVLRAGADKYTVYTPIHLHSEGLALGLLIAWVVTQKPDMLKLGLRTIVLICLLTPPIAMGLRILNHDGLTYSSWTLLYGVATVVALQIGLLSMPLSRWQGFYTLSRLSYEVYLNHQILVENVTPLAQRFVGTGLVGYVVWSAAVIVASMGIAFLTFAAIEAPFLRMRTRWLEASRAKRAVKEGRHFTQSAG